MSGNKKGQRLTAWILTGLTVLLAIALCWAALDLWLEGRAIRQTSPAAVIYSPEAVHARAGKVLPVFLAWLVALVAALCFGPRNAKPFHPRTRASAQAAVPTPRRLQWLRIGLFAAAAVLIVLGVLNGGLRDVLVKAVNLCTECIGLG